MRFGTIIDMAQHAPISDGSLPFSLSSLSAIVTKIGFEVAPLAGQATGLQEKGDPHKAPDLATEQDRHTQKELVQALGDLDPDAEVLAEEEGVDPPQGSTYWVIDPIDGTNNFINGLPLWATNVGYVRDGHMVAAVTAAPALHTCWSASCGGGAFCGERPLSVSQRTMRMSTLGLTVQPRHFERLQRGGRYDDLHKLFQAVRCTRVLGSMAVELAWCASGKLDLWVGGGYYWDHGPGSLLVEEAGGVFKRDALGSGIHMAGAMSLVEAALNLIGTGT